MKTDCIWSNCAVLVLLSALIESCCVPRYGTRPYGACQTLNWKKIQMIMIMIIPKKKWQERISPLIFSKCVCVCVCVFKPTYYPCWGSHHYSRHLLFSHACFRKYTAPNPASVGVRTVNFSWEHTTPSNAKRTFRVLAKSCDSVPRIESEKW